MKFSPFMPKLSTEEKLKWIDEKIGKLSKMPQVIAIILFGSQATGKARPDSDVDLAVVTKSSSEKEKMNMICESDEVIQVSHFNTLPLEIQFRVIKEGKVIYCRNESELKKHKVRAILNYLDFAPVLHHFYRRVMENV